MTAAGVAAGAVKPNQISVGKPSSPLSCSVGTSGSSRQRCALETASARNLPARISGNSTDLAPGVHLDLVAQDIGDGRRGAFVGNEHDIGPGPRPEKCQQKMRRDAEAWRPR